MRRAVAASAAPTRPPASLVRKYWKTARIAASVPFYKHTRDKAGYATWLKSELEDAGCLFVKMGQWVASRADIFPRDVVAAFSTLQSGVSPMPPAELERIVGESGVEFERFDPSPLSCGSVAQVHRAVFGGKEVAVKVQRPHLGEGLREDLNVVRRMLWPLRLQNAKSYADAVKSLDELGATVLRETDFEAEAANMALFQGMEGVRVPAVVAATPRLIVMEYVPSVAITDPGACTRLMSLFLRQFFELGCVHTDLHAGNLGVDSEGRLVMYDFGSVLRCPQSMRDCIKRLFIGYLNRTPAVMLDYLVEHDMIRSRAPLTREQRATLEAFVGTVVDYVETTDIKTFNEGVRSIPVPASLPDVEFRPEVFMVFRSFTLLEGLCKAIDPDFVIVDAMMPFAAELLADPDMYRMKVEDDMRTLAKIFE